MARKLRLLLAAPLAVALLFLLYLHRQQPGRLPYSALPGHHAHEHHDAPKTLVGEPAVAPARDGASLGAANITAYLDAILHGGPTRPLPSFQCPDINNTRYAPLRPAGSPASAIRYFFALNLRECLPLLPRLLGSVVEAIRFLGPQHCALSIVEGNSPDGTADVLAALRPGLEALGTAYFFQSSPIDTHEGDRISRLAELRNLALEPLLRNASRADKDTTIVFANDVTPCAEDLLELVLQRQRLRGDMTCAMDWTCNDGDPPTCTFYDIWIARGINGDSFFRIPPDTSWRLALHLFWNEEASRSRFTSHRPFQVFACWNGATAFGAQPILDGLRFRAADTEAGECYQGEPQLFCKDMWFRGFGKIAVVPSVNLAYSLQHGELIKREKGFVSDIVATQDSQDDAIDWQPDPPEQVRCMPSFEKQFWQPWNETL